MVDSLFQGFGSGVGGTHNAVLSSTDYLSTAMRTLGNIEDGFCECGPACSAAAGCRRARIAHRAAIACRGTRAAPALACLARPACPLLPAHPCRSRPAPWNEHLRARADIAPAFLDKMSIHIAKNFLDLPKIKVPLILGIWGGKGQGKTFQVRAAPGWAGSRAGRGPGLVRPAAALMGRAAPPSQAAPAPGARAPVAPRRPHPPPPCSATWPTRSWASRPSSCPPVSWRAATPASPPSSSASATGAARWGGGRAGGAGQARAARCVLGSQRAACTPACSACCACLSHRVSSPLFPPVTQRGLRHHQEGQGGRSSQFHHVFQSLGVSFRRCPRHSRPLRFLSSGGAQSCPAVVRPPVPI